MRRGGGEKMRSGAAVHSGRTPNFTGPDSYHTFEFPASRKTFHELGSSSLEEVKDVRFGC